MDYYAMYPWAKLDILKETTSYAAAKNVHSFCHVQALSHYGDEKDVEVLPCSP